MLRHLQTHQVHAPTYILENVPLLGDIRFYVMASVHEIRSWIRFSGFIKCSEGWFACSSSTIVVDELVVEGGVEIGI